jgi:hypothetical protein
MEATRWLGALLLIARGLYWMDNLRPGGTLRWKVETVSWEGQGVVFGKLAPPKL